LALKVGRLNPPLMPLQVFADLLLLRRNRSNLLLVVSNRAQCLP
jgi:hypothetical protein